MPGLEAQDTFEGIDRHILNLCLSTSTTAQEKEPQQDDNGYRDPDKPQQATRQHAILPR